MRTIKRNGLSRGATILAVAILAVVFVAALVLATHRPPSPQTTTTTPTITPTTSTTPTPTTPTATTTTPTTQSSTTTSTRQAFTLAPPNTSVLVDDSQEYTPDALDPATGFTGYDANVFTNVFQGLVAYNGSNYFEVVPALASNYSAVDNYQSYIFTIRPGVTFSNGDPVNAYDAWFSFVREVYLGQSVGISNYEDLTVNLTEYSATGYILPWGIRHAVQYAFNLSTLPTYNQTVKILNSVLSNFNPSNTTIQRLMSYPNQAYVVEGPMTFRVNLLAPYRYFLLDIAAWWGAIVDPAYVDAHGGVQYGTTNSYFDANGGPGTGPYMIRSVTPGFSTVVLVRNPDYWGARVGGLPPILQPAKIPVVVINYGLPQNERVEAFATNQAQISYVDIPFLNQMYQAYHYRQYFGFKQIFFDFGFFPELYFIALNTQKFPTDNNYFRLAIVHAINYTEILDKLYTFNGTRLGELYLGPLTPEFGQFYDPGNLPPYQYNINLAAEYLNKSLYQLGYYTVMPNGTVLGNQSDPQLPTITLYYLSPITPLMQEELEIVQAGLSQLGLSVALQGVTTTVYYSWTTPQEAPAMVDWQWGPDWPDPVFQMIAPAVTTTSYIPAWVNVSRINQIVAQLPFETNQTEQLEQVKYIYNFTYWYAPYVWLPNVATYYFAQPYVKGFIYNTFIGYPYNTMYYSPATAD